MTTVDRVLEEIAERRSAHRRVPRRRAHGVDDVAEPVAVRSRVVLEHRVLAVQRLPARLVSYDRVGDAALDRDGDRAAVPRAVVGDHLAGLVGALQYRTHDGTRGELTSLRSGTHRDDVGSLRALHSAHILDCANDRRRADVGVRAEPLQESCEPRRIGHGDFVHERAEPVGSVVRRLIERLLSEEPASAEHEQLSSRVALEAGSTFVGAEIALTGTRHGRRGRGARACAVEFRHICPLFVGGRTTP